MQRRYERNMLALTADENERLKGFKVCVVGCGGLGGYVIEHLGRIGICKITAVDGDVFEETNLNRQLLSDESVLGQSKAKAAEARMKKVNSDVEITAIDKYLTGENCKEIFAGHDIIIDALDNIPARIIIEQAAQELGIPLVHGAIAGWYGQVCVVMPGMPVFDKIYPEGAGKGVENTLGNLPFTAAAVASVQASEAVKVLLGKGEPLSSRLLSIDLISNEFEKFEI